MAGTYGAVFQSYGASGGTYGDLSGASAVFVKGQGAAAVSSTTMTTATVRSSVTASAGVS